MTTLLVNIDVDPLHLDFVAADIDAANARSRPARPKKGRSANRYGKPVLLHDPFGHGACLLQFSAQGYDAIATGG